MENPHLVISGGWSLKERQTEESAVSELRKRLGISVSLSSNGVPIVDELEDRELNELASSLIGERVSAGEHMLHIQALRDHWKNSTARAILLKELGALLRDYQRQITRRHLENGGSESELIESASPGKMAYGFYHIRDVNQLRMDDIPKLLAGYKKLSN